MLSAARQLGTMTKSFSWSVLSGEEPLDLLAVKAGSDVSLVSILE